MRVQLDKKSFRTLVSRIEHGRITLTEAPHTGNPQILSFIVIDGFVFHIQGFQEEQGEQMGFSDLVDIIECRTAIGDRMCTYDVWITTYELPRCNQITRAVEEDDRWEQSSDHMF